MHYDGGKGKCFQRIINLMPPHRVYIEAFLGGGAVLRNKRPAERTIGIDLDPRVIASWRKMDDQNVELHCGDAREFLAGFRFSGGELVYADPPYLPVTRRRPICYRHDFDTADHISLLDLLRSLGCLVVLSGYPSPLYDESLKGWWRVDFLGTSHIGRRAESVWLNYEPPTDLHDYRFVGDTFRHRERLRRKMWRWEDRLARMPALEREALLRALNERFGRSTSAASTSQRPSESYGLYVGAKSGAADRS